MFLTRKCSKIGAGDRFTIYTEKNNTNKVFKNETNNKQGYRLTYSRFGGKSKGTLQVL